MGKSSPRQQHPAPQRDLLGDTGSGDTPGTLFGEESLGFTTKAADLLLAKLPLRELLFLSFSKRSAHPQL